MEQHTCRDCKQTFPLTKEFFYLYPEKPERQTHPPYCKRCSVVRSSAWSRGQSSEKKTGVYIQNLHKRLGLAIEDYRALLQAADYKCEICGKPHCWEPTKKYERSRLGVDHDHETGVVRGVLCNKCNAAIGLLQDSVDLIDRAAVYLRKHKS